MQAASGETLLQQVFPAWLTDLDTDNIAPPTPSSDGLPMTGAFDSAKAKLKVTETSDGNTTFRIEVRNIDHDPVFEGRTFGAHLHTGSCEADVPTAAGPHYKHADPDMIFPNNEVWLDVTVNEGKAVTTTVVPFVPKDPDGLMSVVIHTDFTKPDGSAGPREACLPLDVTGTWAPPVIGTP